jgi:hypothetical protein
MGRPHPRIFWSVTAGNLLICGLLVAFIYLILQLMGVAAGVETWPLWTSLAVGLLLTAISWGLVRSLNSARQRLWGYVFNGGALAVYLLFISCIATLWFHATRRLFLVPAGFEGSLYLVHDPKSPVEGRKHFLRTVYRFPSDGVLVVPTQRRVSFPIATNTSTPMVIR